jgi:hypothetical protein
MISHKFLLTQLYLKISIFVIKLKDNIKKYNSNLITILIWMTWYDSKQNAAC